jgi:hypothetical protein
MVKTVSFKVISISTSPNDVGRFEAHEATEPTDPPQLVSDAPPTAKHICILTKIAHSKAIECLKVLQQEDKKPELYIESAALFSIIYENTPDLTTELRENLNKQDISFDALIELESSSDLGSLINLAKIGSGNAFVSISSLISEYPDPLFVNKLTKLVLELTKQLFNEPDFKNIETMQQFPLRQLMECLYQTAIKGDSQAQEQVVAHFIAIINLRQEFNYDPSLINDPIQQAIDYLCRLRLSNVQPAVIILKKYFPDLTIENLHQNGVVSSKRPDPRSSYPSLNTTAFRPIQPS